MTNTRRITEESSDMEIALKLADHIDAPCSVIVDGKRENIRDFYLREAEGIIPTFTNEYAKRFLQLKIDTYKPKVSSQ